MNATDPKPRPATGQTLAAVSVDRSARPPILPLVLAALLIAASPLAAEDTRISDQAELNRALQNLDSPSFDLRRAAERELRAAQGLDLQTLRTWYNQSASLERRARLLPILYHHVLTLDRLAAAPGGGPDQPLDTDPADRPPDLNPLLDDGTPGAIGVLHRPIPDLNLTGRTQPAVQVQYTHPGYPGYAYLEPGDLILGLNGQRFSETFPAQRFRQHIQTFRPGQAITLQILRDSTTRDITFRLASAASLEALTARGGQSRDTRWRAFLQTLDRPAEATSP